MKLQKAKEGSFMAWYSHLGFTKDKVSELLKTYELYIQAPHMKDYISSLSGVAVRLLTHKDVDPQLALDIMEKRCEKHGGYKRANRTSSLSSRT